MLQSRLYGHGPANRRHKAWVGGIDFKTYKFDHVNINTKRQVGSTIKPLLYGLAINDGGFTPSTPVEDVQQNFEGFWSGACYHSIVLKPNHANGRSACPIT